MPLGYHEKDDIQASLASSRIYLEPSTPLSRSARGQMRVCTHFLPPRIGILFSFPPDFPFTFGTISANPTSNVFVLGNLTKSNTGITSSTRRPFFKPHPLIFTILFLPRLPFVNLNFSTWCKPSVYPTRSIIPPCTSRYAGYPDPDHGMRAARSEGVTRSWTSVVIDAPVGEVRVTS